jgi:hypothetical protein
VNSCRQAPGPGSRRVGPGIGSGTMPPPSTATAFPPGEAVEPSTGSPGAGRQDRRAVGLGLAGVLLAFIVLATLHAVTVPPFLPADEQSHTAYGLLVAQARLPTLTTPAPLLQSPGVGSRVYTANHPPLYYALVAMPLRLGLAIRHPVAGFVAARLLTVLAAAAGIAAVAALVLVLSPGRPQLALAAAAIGPLLPSFVHISGLVHNDALGFTTATVTLAVAALVLIRGPSARRLAVLAAAAAAAALTRASGLPFAVLAVLAAGLAPLVDGRRPTLVRVGAAAVQAALVAGVVLVVSGWFYLRNQVLYGGLTGTSENLRMFGLNEHRPILGVLVSGRFWSGVYDQLWGRMAGGQFLAAGPLALPGRLLGVVVIAGLTVGGVRVARSRRPAAGGGRLAAWLLVLVTVPLTLVTMAGYVAAGGGTHARYLYPGLGVISLIAAVGLAELPGRRRSLLILAVLAGQVTFNLLLWATFLSRTTVGRPGLVAAVGQGVPAIIGLPAALVVPAAVVLLAAALAMVGRALWMLDDGQAMAAMPDPAPAAPGWAPGGSS